jgi:septum site-determining protein MinD
MAMIISVHSFRGGTGKSNLVANMATTLALQGHRVGVMDTDIQSPGVHVLFGFDNEQVESSLNDYLWAKVPIEQTAIALHERDDSQRPFLKGTEMWLIPASVHPNDIAKVLREGYDVNLLQQGFHRLVDSLALDYLIIDTHPGLDEETLLAIAMSNVLVLLLRTDRQDVHGTAVTIEIARKLEVPKIRLVVNKVPMRYDFNQIRQNVEATYDVPVAGLLPLSEDIAVNGSANVFGALYPDHAWPQAVQAITAEVIDTTK